jgi:hypothetical protein
VDHQPVKLIEHHESMTASHQSPLGTESKMLRSSDCHKNYPNKQADSIMNMHVIEGEQKRAYHKSALMYLGFTRGFNFPAYKVDINSVGSGIE